MWTILIITVILFALLIMLAWKKPGLAMGLLPLTAVTPVLAGLIGLEQGGDERYIIIVIGGIALFCFTVIMIRFKPLPILDNEPWYKSVSRVFFDIFAAILYGTLLVGIFQVFGGVLLVLSLILVFRYRQTRRYSQALNVLTTISAAMRQNLPLPMALETAASNPKDPAAAIYHNTAKFLCEGRTLTESLRRAYRKCPAEILSTLAAAEAMNQLPQAVAALEQDSISSVNEFEKVRPIHPAYPIIVGSLMALIILGLCVFILPTFTEVLHDMSDGESGLPGSTRFLVKIAREVSSPAVVLVIVLLLVLGLISGGYAYNCPRRPDRPRLLSRLGDWVRWHTPGVRHFERLRSVQRTIQGLRVGLKSGYSFDTIVRHTLELDVNWCYQMKLRRWLGQIESGQPIADSAAACGVGHTLAWALDEKVNKGNTPELLAMLEEVYRNRYHYRLNIFHSILWPFVVVGMGGVVGFVIFAMFSAMVRMITVTMDYSMP